MLNEASIVCIAKNEESFINEWIYYHIKLGFSKIIIYDNSDNYSLNYLKNALKIITYILGYLLNFFLKEFYLQRHLNLLR